MTHTTVWGIGVTLAENGTKMSCTMAGRDPLPKSCEGMATRPNKAAMRCDR